MRPDDMSPERERLSAHVRAFSRLLVRLRSELGNDLDLVLILSVIAERHYAVIEAMSDPGAPGADPAAARGRCAINAHSVALYAGIPRETARRKIAALIDRGWVERDAAGALFPTARAAGDLADATAATARYLRAVTGDVRPWTGARAGSSRGEGKPG